MQEAIGHGGPYGIIRRLGNKVVWTEARHDASHLLLVAVGYACTMNIFSVSSYYLTGPYHLSVNAF